MLSQNQINEINEIFNQDSTANDHQVFELEKELSNNFEKDLTIYDKIEILERSYRMSLDLSFSID